MAKLVFVDNQSNAAGWAFDDAGDFVSDLDGGVGIWSVDGSGANVVNDRLHAEADVVITGGVIQPKQFQITQGRGATKMPYASPIINRSDVKKWSITHYDPGAKAAIGGASATFGNQVVGNTFGIKIVTKGGANTSYEEFINPSNTLHARTGQVFNYEFKATVVTAATNCQALADVINADEASPVTASVSTADLTLTAKSYDLGFEVIDLSSTSSDYTAIVFSGSDTIVGSAAPDYGTGNGWQAVAAEKQFEGYKLGMHNKIHLPITPDRYAVAATTYDIMTIEVDNVKDGAPGNDSLVIEMWIPSGWTDTGVIDHQFAGGGNGAVAAHGTAAGATVVLYERMS